MAIDTELFIHESDKAALKALKAIPGFTQVLKAFVKIWNESQYRILNMSTFLKISEDQMAEYYDMLKPICKKLGIKTPDLYVSLDPRPNAYTSGDTDPFIVVTSGMLTSFPKELLPVVLAHECGHIVCHHVLYKTMGKMILNGAADFLGLSSLLTAPLKVAFYYWMRCSEYSADRVSAVCCGSDAVTRMCMGLAGYDHNIPVEANVEAFLKQGEDYKELIKSSAFNKSLEFLMFNSATHPMNAVRAYECNKWSESDMYRYATAYLAEEDSEGGGHSRVPMSKSAKDYLSRDYKVVLSELRKLGFTNMFLKRKTEYNKSFKEDTVCELTIADRNDFSAGTWFGYDDKVVIYYYKPKTLDEIKAEHPDELVVPASSTSYTGRGYTDVMNELYAAGFKNIETRAVSDLKMGIFNNVNDIASIEINGVGIFEMGDVFPKDSVVLIKYHVF